MSCLRSKFGCGPMFPFVSNVSLLGVFILGPGAAVVLDELVVVLNARLVEMLSPVESRHGVPCLLPTLSANARKGLVGCCVEWPLICPLPFIVEFCFDNLPLIHMDIFLGMLNCLFE